MKLATPIGALSGKSVQVSLPAVVSIMAAGPAAGAAAGLAATAATDFFAGADLAAGAVCDQAAEHARESNKQTKRLLRMESPDAETRSTGQVGHLPYLVCDDCEVRFYSRVRQKLLACWRPPAFGLHFVANSFHLAEYPQQVASKNLTDVRRAVAAVEQRLCDLGKVGGGVDAFGGGTADAVKVRPQANMIHSRD